MIDPASPYHSPRRRWTPAVLLMLLLTLLVGAIIGAWVADRSQSRWPFANAPEAVSAAPAPTPPKLAAPAPPVGVEPSAKVATAGRIDDPVLAARLAVIDDRIARLDTAMSLRQTNADRAEALVIALAARRAIDRGLPLGSLVPQLRLQFADSQPNAVASIVSASGGGDTISALARRLEALEAVTLQPPARSLSQRISDFTSNLIVLRPADSPSTLPTARYADAREKLADGDLDAAIASVNALPGAGDARVQQWLAEARRYAEVRRALDLIEDAALRRGEDPPNIPPRRLGVTG